MKPGPAPQEIPRHDLPEVATPGEDRAVAAILAALARGEIPDDDVFDAIYAPRWRELSWQHWTPTDIADLAVDWLTRGGARRVLDVGSGIGKLCAYGALVTDDVTFVGVEHRAELVEEARRTAERLGVAHRLELRHGTLDDVDPADIDAVYLYNPFAENRYADEIDRIDSSVPLGEEHFERDVGAVMRWLERAPIGLRLVTFHGFGGEVPACFRPVATHRSGRDTLRAWQKHLPSSALREKHRPA